MKRILTLLSFGLVAALLAVSPVAAQQKGGEKKAPAAAKEVPMSERCIGKTQDGDQCKRKAADGRKYCWQHDPNRKTKSSKKPA
jgi:hypothetical protein